jgi:hypothetical protein
MPVPAHPENLNLASLASLVRDLREDCMDCWRKSEAQRQLCKQISDLLNQKKKRSSPMLVIDQDRCRISLCLPGKASPTVFSDLDPYIVCVFMVLYDNYLAFLNGNLPHLPLRAKAIAREVHDRQIADGIPRKLADDLDSGTFRESIHRLKNQQPDLWKLIESRPSPSGGYRLNLSCKQD